MAVARHHLSLFETLPRPRWVATIEETPLGAVPLPARLWVSVLSLATKRDPADHCWSDYKPADLTNVGHGSAAAHITLQRPAEEGYTPDEAAGAALQDLTDAGAAVWWRDLPPAILQLLAPVIKRYTVDPKGLMETYDTATRHDFTTFIEMLHLMAPSARSLTDQYADAVAEACEDAEDADADTMYPDDWYEAPYREAWGCARGFLCVPCPVEWCEHATPALYF